MKRIFLVISIALVNCGPSRSNNNSTIKDNQTPGRPNDQEIPVCVQKMITQYQGEEKQNPPRQIYSYLYQGKTVYYVTPPCCDFFSDLYDSACVVIGHPDGGFTGRGDGKMNDFKDARTNEKLIWKDERK